MIKVINFKYTFKSLMSVFRIDSKRFFHWQEHHHPKNTDSKRPLLHESVIRGIEQN